MSLSLKEIGKMFASVQPRHLERYAVEHGWQLLQRQPRAIVYRKYDEKEEVFYISIPAEPSFADYQRRIADVIDTLVHAESKSLWDLKESILRGDDNILKFRYISEGVEDGTISIDDSVRIRAARKKLLLAAAHAVTKPQYNYAKLSKAEPLRLLANCRERASKAGSYISEVVIPSTLPNDEKHAESEHLFDEPYPRQVLVRLQQFLKLVRDPGMGPNPRHAFLMAEVAVVSSNFLEALSDLHPPGHKGALQVSFGWSHERPPIKGEEMIEFHDSDFDSFQRAAEILKESAPIPETELVGYVRKLSKKKPKKRDVEGSVTMMTFIDGKACVASMTLSPEFYRTAVSAHNTASAVSVTGVLSKTGTRYTLLDVDSFQVTSSDKEADEPSETRKSKKRITD